MQKFIQTSISLHRVPPSPISPTRDRIIGSILAMSYETLTITLEYIASGDTSKITNDELIDKIQKLLGYEIK